MSRIARLATAVRRYSRSRGFGIHSPFAFHYVREVLCQREAYYAYADIAERWSGAASTSAMSRREARLLFRVACECNPSVAIYLNAATPRHFIPLLLSHSRLTVCHRTPDVRVQPSSRLKELPPDAQFVAEGASLAVADDVRSAADAELLRAVIASGGVVVLRNLHRRRHSTAALYRELKAEMQHGMTFTDGCTAVIVARAHLPRQDFSIRL